MKMGGNTWRELEDDPTLGTLMRNLRRRDVSAESPVMQANLRKILKKVPHPHRDLILSALDGNVQSKQQIMEFGIWATYSAGVRATATDDVAHPAPFIDHYAHLEPLCKDADAALASGDFQGAAMFIQQSPQLAPYWRHGSLDRLASSASAETALSSQFVAWLELQIAVITKWGNCDPEAIGYQNDSMEFSHLLDGAEAKPGAQWMLCVRRYAGANSMAALYARADQYSETYTLPSEATAKRWGSGQTFPKPEPAEGLVRAILDGTHRLTGEPERQRAIYVLGTQYGVARRFDATLRFAGYIEKRSRDALRMLLAADTSTEWAQQSYKHWTTHWREHSCQ